MTTTDLVFPFKLTGVSAVKTKILGVVTYSFQTEVQRAEFVSNIHERRALKVK